MSTLTTDCRGPLNDTQIRLLSNVGLQGPLVSPVVNTLQGSQSFGVSSYGYDARLASSFVRYRPQLEHKDDVRLLDPCGVAPDSVERWTETSEYYVIRPSEFILGHTVETFCVPDNVIAICIGKSSYARCGIHVNVTPLEPGWRGQVTLEIHNHNCRPVKLYIGRGIAQFVFHAGTPCQETYGTRKGKYQNQAGVTLPRAGS